MSHNELQDMPPDIGDLVKLQRIDLSHNNLYGVPMEIGKLQKVTCMDVSYNKLLSLPNEIGNMTSLSDLNFEHNDLIFLPVNLEALETCLTKLNADANKILDPPAEILHQGRDAVFTYFGFGSFHGEAVNFFFVDGSARPLAKTMDKSILNALATRNGQERISDQY